MGLLSTWDGGGSIGKKYSIFLKLEGQIYLGIFLVTYLVKWGVAWHYAGEPGDLTDVRFSAYWNMILILYTSLGAFLTAASFDPPAFKALIAWSMWGANFAHGTVALIHCFTDNDSVPVLTGSTGSYIYAYRAFGVHNNIDKLLVAVPLWFGLGFTNLYFAKKVFGSYLLPWDLLKDGKSSQVVPSA